MTDSVSPTRKKLKRQLNKRLFVFRRMSKTFEKATEEFYSSVSKRTRSKRYAYSEVKAQACFPSLAKKRRRRQPPPSSVGGRRNVPDLPDIERIDESEFMRVRSSLSKERGSAVEGLYKGANSLENVEIPSEKPFGTVEIPNDIVKPFRVPKGKGKKTANWFERIDKAEFISQLSFSMSKVGFSNKSSSAATPRKADNVSKRATSTSFLPSFIPKDGLDHARSHQSSSFVLIESDSDNEKTHTDQVLCTAALREKAKERNISSADVSVSFPPRDYCANSETLAADSIKLPETANSNNILRETGNGKGKGLLSSEKNSETVKEMPLFSTNAGSYLTNTDSEDLECVRIDEAEAEAELRKRRQFVSVGESSTRKKLDEERAATISRNRKRRRVSDSDESGDSSTRAESSSNAANASLQDYEVSSCSAELEKSAGVANRTRPRIGGNEKPAQGGDVSLDSSTHFDSSSTDDSGDDSRDEDFEVEDSIHENEFLGSHDDESDFQEEEEEGENAERADGENDRAGSRGAASLSNSKDLDDHVIDLSDDGTEEKTGAASSPSSVHEKNKTLDMAEERGMASKAKEAAPHSHSTDLSDHTDYGDEKRNVATFSLSCVRAKNKTSETANEKMMPSKGKEAAADPHSKDLCDHANDGTEERIGETGSRLHVRAKKKIENRAHEKKVPSKSKEAALQYHRKDHTNGGTEERIGETGSPLHVCAKKKIEDKAREKRMASKAKEADPHSRAKDLRHHTNDGSEERIGETSSRLHVRAGRKNGDIANEKKTPSSNSKDMQYHTEDGTKERRGHNSSSHVHAQNETSKGKEAVSPSQSKDLYNHSYDGVEEMQSMNKTVETSDEEIQTGRKQVSSRTVNDLLSMLADAVLGRESLPGNKENNEEVEHAPASQTRDTLPLRFRFEDEIPEVVEKTEYEKEIDNLFGELERMWELYELETFDYVEGKLENVNSHPEETQHARCCRGKHELVLEDEEGLICIFCRHVEIGPKDVMPEWAEIIYRKSKKRCTEREQPSESDELPLHSSTSDDDDARNTTYTSGTVWSIKPCVRESMYEHQREGFEFLWKNLAGSINLDELKSNVPKEVGGCIISHAPGTGKTRLTIVFVETYLKMFPKCMPVIISPASTLLTWEEEFKKWKVGFPFHNLSNTDLSGNENKTALRFLPRTKIRDSESVRMTKICSWSMGESILGISYSLFEKLAGGGNRNAKQKTDKKIRKILLEMPGIVVLDEGHTPRNQRSNIWNVLLKLKTQKRVILSGTPFQNNFNELFNTLHLVRPAKADMLAQEKTFAEILAPRRKSSEGRCRRENSQSSLVSDVVDRAVEKLKICISTFVHLHKGTILQQNLPGLRDCVVLLNPPALQKSLIENIKGSNNFKVEHEIAMLSVHPYLFLQCETSEDHRSGIDMDAVKASELNCQEGVKTRFLLELIRLSMAVKEKILVFSQYIDPLKLVKEQLKEVFKWVEGKQILLLQGRQTQKQRQILINQFNDPHSNAKIMLASTKCCAEGISLVGASRVVLLDVVWNPSVERQAICRAYRIGQKKFVHTYHLMTCGTTEADKYCRQAEKERLSELVFSSSNKSNQQMEASSGIKDRLLEVMVANESLKGMFEKIINQPKGTDLIQTFGLTS